MIKITDSKKKEVTIGDAVFFIDSIGIRRNDQIKHIQGDKIQGKFFDLSDKDFTKITAEFSY